MSVRKDGVKSTKYVIVDASDYEEMIKYKWHAKRDNRRDPSVGHRIYYAARRFWMEDEQRWKEVVMHRQLLGVNNSGVRLAVDHINGNGLDNRRKNIRLCTLGENSRNLHFSWGKVGIRGVNKAGKKWRTRIRFNGKLVCVGFYQTERDAAVAYAFASRVFHGEFGSLPGHDLRWHKGTSKVLKEDAANCPEYQPIEPMPIDMDGNPSITTTTAVYTNHP